jgi:hypothetical protein
MVAVQDEHQRDSAAGAAGVRRQPQREAAGPPADGQLTGDHAVKL